MLSAASRPSPFCREPHQPTSLACDCVIDGESYASTTRSTAPSYRTMADVIAHLPHFLEQTYNNNRPHAALNYSVTEHLRGRARPVESFRSKFGP